MQGQAVAPAPAIQVDEEPEEASVGSEHDGDEIDFEEELGVELAKDDEDDDGEAGGSCSWGGSAAMMMIKFSKISSAEEEDKPSSVRIATTTSATVTKAPVEPEKQLSKKVRQFIISCCFLLASTDMCTS